MKLRFLLVLSSCFFFVNCSAQVRNYKAEVVREYPHDVSSYTQGLFFHADTLFESTGQWGESTFRKVDLESGKAIKKINFNKKYFAEGSCMLDGKLYILTWTSKVIFIYDAQTLEYKQTYSYPREGWGLTTDGTSLIASDGSSKLYFLDSNLNLKKTINVSLNGVNVRFLNELEWIDGKIWANIYTTDTIVIIDPNTGKVTATVDCTNLLPAKLRSSKTDVLNGIAVDRQGRIFLTGKYWPRLYQIRLKESVR